MKKFFGVTVVLLALLLALSACSGDITSTAEPLIQEFVTALAMEDMDAAEELTHPAGRQEEARAALEEIAEFLDGRAATACSIQEWDAYKRVGGSEMTESGNAEVTLDDGTIIYVRYVYAVTEEGMGFTTFRISLDP